MLAGLDLDATQLGGMAAFAWAALACAVAAGRHAKPRASLWRALAALQLACAAEVVLGWRYRLHAAANALLESQGWYASRTGLQIGLIGVALLLIAIALAVAAARGRGGGRAAAVAVAGSGVALALFVVETISLHAVDALMYASVGPVKLIGWLWAGAAAIVIIAALRAAR